MQADLRLCWSHIPHCWNFHVAAKFNLCTLIWRSDFVSFFTIFSTGKDGVGKEYYSIDCILFLLKNVHLAHPLYVREAAVSWHTYVIGLVNPFIFMPNVFSILINWRSPFAVSFTGLDKQKISA